MAPNSFKCIVLFFQFVYKNQGVSGHLIVDAPVSKVRLIFIQRVPYFVEQAHFRLYSGKMIYFTANDNFFILVKKLKTLLVLNQYISDGSRASSGLPRILSVSADRDKFWPQLNSHGHRRWLLFGISILFGQLILHYS